MLVFRYVFIAIASFHTSYMLLPAGAAVRFFKTGKAVCYQGFNSYHKHVLCEAKLLWFAAMQPDFRSDDSALSYRV
jgi:hypothetical protein